MPLFWLFSIFLLLRLFSLGGERGQLFSCGELASHCAGFSYYEIRACGPGASTVGASGLLITAPGSKTQAQ